jgi:HEPN domain-containing protein
VTKKKRRYLATDGFRSADLLQYARDHLASARLLFDTSFQAFDSAGHLSHLGIELLLKAVLLDLVGEFPNEHKLRVLVDEIRMTKPTSLDDEDAQRLLTRLEPFVVLRYPNPSEPVTVGSEDMASIDRVCEAILGEMSIDFRTKYMEADPTTKGGRVLMSRRKRPDEL